jgi:hypothetical protein
MAAMVGRYAGKKIMQSAFNDTKGKDVAGPKDPLYARVPHPRKPGKFKKVKKQIPDYIPEEDAIILAKVRSRAYSLDVKYGIGKYRFGNSALWGIIPVAGDIIDLLFALRLVQLCKGISCGLSRAVLMRMMVNIAIDYVIGLIPLLGDLADAAFKANTANTRLLEERLDAVYKPKLLRSDRRPAEASYPATVFEDCSEDEQDPELSRRDGDVNPRRPEASHARHQSRGSREARVPSRSNRPREQDPEMGEVRRHPSNRR